MRSHFAIGCLAVAAVFLTSCALPTKPIEDTQTFVPKQEIIAADLATTGGGLFGSSRFVEAIGKFQLALGIAPEASNLKANLASAYERAGLLDEAEELYSELKAASPNAVRYALALARVAALKGDVKDAERAYIEAHAIALSAGDAGSAYLAEQSLAALYFKIGDVDNAVCVASALRQARMDLESMLRESRFLISSDRFSEASAALAKFSAETGQDRLPELLTQRVLAAYGEEKIDDAVAVSIVALREPAIVPLDASTLKFVLALAGKLPLNEDQDEDEVIEEALKPLLNANAANFLFWPVNLLERFVATKERIESDE